MQAKSFNKNSCFTFMLLNINAWQHSTAFNPDYSFIFKRLKMNKHYNSHLTLSYATRFLHSFHTNLPVPEAWGRLLVWTKKILHGEVSIKDPWEGFHPLSVHSCVSTACHYYLFLLFLHVEESGTGLCGTSG